MAGTKHNKRASDYDHIAAEQTAEGMIAMLGYSIDAWLRRDAMVFSLAAVGQERCEIDERDTITANVFRAITEALEEQKYADDLRRGIERLPTFSASGAVQNDAYDEARAVLLRAAAASAGLVEAGNVSARAIAQDVRRACDLLFERGAVVPAPQ